MNFLQQLNQWDQQFFIFLNGIHNTYFDYVMMVFTSESIWIPLYVITAIVIGRKYGKDSIVIFIALGLLILCSDQVAGISKHAVQRLRPSHDPFLSQITHIFNDKGGMYSFYSAHSSNAFAYATFTILLFRNRIYTLIIIPWALLVPYTRIYLGLHYPGDILCGAIAGIIIAFGIYRLMILTNRRFFSPVLISTIPLRKKEISLIITTELLSVIITLMIIHLLVSRQLVL